MPFTVGTVTSLLPFVATFAVVFFLAATKLFPRLSRWQDALDGEGHFLPSSAPPNLRQAHAEHGARSLRRRVAAATLGVTVALAAVLAELILSEISDLVGPHARDVALRVIVPTLLFLLVVLIPFLELQSLVSAWGWSFQPTAKGRLPCLPWLLQLLAFAAWLFLFWSIGKAVPADDGVSSTVLGRYLSAGSPVTVHKSVAHVDTRAEAGKAAVRFFEPARLSRACLERIGVIGISLMALLSGFASISSPWQTFVERRAYRRRPITDADIAWKRSGLEATSEMLAAKRHRLQSLQRKAAAQAEGLGVPLGVPPGLVGMMMGTLKSISGAAGGDAVEIRSLQMEVSGLETMEANLAASLSTLRARQAAHARDGTVLGRLLAIPGYAFSAYCIYRVVATTLTAAYRFVAMATAAAATASETGRTTAASSQHPSFSSSDPINRFLGLLAKHWDPKLDQIAWARQISFLLSGVILLASANSVVQTFRLFARWAPGLLLYHQAQANLALLVGQVAATYVISSALLLRSNLPRDVGRSVGDALESALEPAFADRWFESWFLFASAGTAVGIWVGRKIAGPGGGGGGGGKGVGLDWDEWDDLAGEEMGAKRSLD